MFHIGGDYGDMTTLYIWNSEFYLGTEEGFSCKTGWNLSNSSSVSGILSVNFLILVIVRWLYTTLKLGNVE